MALSKCCDWNNVFCVWQDTLWYLLSLVALATDASAARSQLDCLKSHVRTCGPAYFNAAATTTTSRSSDVDNDRGSSSSSSGRSGSGLRAFDVEMDVEEDEEEEVGSEGREGERPLLFVAALVSSLQVDQVLICIMHMHIIHPD